MKHEENVEKSFERIKTDMRWVNKKLTITQAIFGIIVVLLVVL